MMLKSAMEGAGNRAPFVLTFCFEIFPKGNFLFRKFPFKEIAHRRDELMYQTPQWVTGKISGLMIVNHYGYISITACCALNGPHRPLL
jgi:hypothetical protein